MAPSLLVICVSAFFAVFVLLSFLAVVIRVLTTACPERVAVGTDTAMIAAVTTAVSVLYPGTMVTKVEEIR